MGKCIFFKFYQNVCKKCKDLLAKGEWHHLNNPTLPVIGIIYKKLCAPRNLWMAHPDATPLLIGCIRHWARSESGSDFFCAMRGG